MKEDLITTYKQFQVAIKNKKENPDVLFIALIETARDVCRVINVDFEDYLSRCIRLGSIDDYYEGEVKNE